MKKKILSAIAIGLVGGALSYGGSESPIRTEGYSPVIWTNNTLRQWVGSVMCSFTTNYPDTYVTISLVDRLACTNIIAYGTNGVMQSFVYISERGPLVLNRGDKLMVEWAAPDSAVVTINNLTGE